MGRPFKIRIRVAAINGLKDVWTDVEVIVDSGAAYTALPKSLLKKLGVKVKDKIKLRLANGDIIERKYGFCQMNVEGRIVCNIVLFANEDDIPLLGMNTLDEASMGIDTVHKRLIPIQTIQALIIL